MKRPKVSIIITTKNEEKRIEHCLKSVKAQTYRDYELIVTDSCSKDDTARIARRYADKVIVRKANIAGGRNMGARAARGEILVFIDADTIMIPETIEKMAEAFDDRKVVGATCPTLPLTVDPRYVSIYMMYNHFARVSIRMRRAQIAGLFCAYRKDAYDREGGFDESVGILEDFHLSARMAKLGRIKFVEDTLVLTSHRRFAKWGIKAPVNYMGAWLKMLATGRSFSYEWYNSSKNAAR